MVNISRELERGLVMMEREALGLENGPKTLLEILAYSGKYNLPEEAKTRFSMEYLRFLRRERRLGWNRHSELDAVEKALFRAELFKRYLANRSLQLQRSSNEASLLVSSRLARGGFNILQEAIARIEAIQDSVSRYEDEMIRKQAPKLGIDDPSRWWRRIEFHANMVHFQSMEQGGSYRIPDKQKRPIEGGECEDCRNIIESRIADSPKQKKQ